MNFENAKVSKISKTKNSRKPTKKRWRLCFYDTFEGEWYGDDEKVSFPSEKAALEAAKMELDRLEILQPSSSSGGQTFGGIQDQVFIIRPDGSRYRV